MVGFTVRVTFDGALVALISAEVAEHLLAVVREAVTNIGRHAEATEASVAVTVLDGLCRLRIADNGPGPRLVTCEKGASALAS